MALLTDFYVAGRHEAASILDGTGIPGRPAARLKGLDPVKLSSLHRILAKHLGAEAGSIDATLLTDEAAEQWVLLVPEALVTLLAQSGTVQDAAAEEWTHTDELKADHWTVGTARTALGELAALATNARAVGSDVLMRMSL
jgi:hypothetical protein